MRRHTERRDPQGSNTIEQTGRRSLRGALEFGKQIARETLRIYASTPRVVALVWRASPLRVVALAILTVLQGLLPTATVWVGKLVVDGVVAAIAVNVGATTAAATTGAVGLTVPPALVGLVGLQFLLAVTGTVLGHVTSIIQQRLSDVVGHRLSVQVLAHANTLDLAHFETPEFYDRLRNAQRLGSQPVQLVTGGLLQVVRNAIVITSMAALLWQFHPLLPMVILVASLPHLVAQIYYSRYGWRLMHRQAPLHRRQSYFGNVMTDNAQAKEIRLFGLGDHLLGRYVEAALLAMRQNWDFRARQRRTATLLSLLSTAVASGAYLYIVAQTVAGRITLGDLTLYSAAVNQTQSTLLGLLGSVTSVYETNLQVDDLFTFLDYRPRIRSGTGRARVPVPLQQGVEFRNVSFSYPPSTPNGQAGNGREATPFAAMSFGRWMGQAPAGSSWAGRAGSGGNGAARRGWARDVLTDVSFTIPAGKTVALVGQTGRGKRR
ncbi:MAG TPA: ABC transporter ATP-binding protein [Chloroflexota bacterium]|nr:ABC transporter ATP-binding protein [Chloroflexota bacterium]